jgi:hypothetical protein
MSAANLSQFVVLPVFLICENRGKKLRRIPFTKTLNTDYQGGRKMELGVPENGAKLGAKDRRKMARNSGLRNSGKWHAWRIQKFWREKSSDFVALPRRCGGDREGQGNKIRCKKTGRRILFRATTNKSRLFSDRAGTNPTASKFTTTYNASVVVG